MNKSKAIIVCIIIVAVTIIAAFYILNSGKTNLPVSSNTNQALVAFERQPSKTVKEYVDSSGFSFKYPQDVQVSKKDTTNDATAYANLEIISSQAKGSISVKVSDTKLKSIDDWFLENELTFTKEVKIGGLSGKEANVNNKIISAALDQNILFTIEVYTQNQKYWQSVYDTILSSFNFVSQEEEDSSGTQSLDDSSSDAVLEEEIVE